MQPVHWVHVYVKVNLIMLIKKGYSGLNKPVKRGEPVSVRVAGSQAMSSVSTTPLKREPELHWNSNQITLCTGDVRTELEARRAAQSIITVPCRIH